MFGFSITNQVTKGEALFSPVPKAKMTDTEKAARYNAQRAGDTRKVAFGFVGQPVPLSQIITSTTDPAQETS